MFARDTAVTVSVGAVYAHVRAVTIDGAHPSSSPSRDLIDRLSHSADRHLYVSKQVAVTGSVPGASTRSSGSRVRSVGRAPGGGDRVSRRVCDVPLRFGPVSANTVVHHEGHDRADHDARDDPRGVAEQPSRPARRTRPRRSRARPPRLPRSCPDRVRDREGPQADVTHARQSGINARRAAVQRPTRTARAPRLRSS